MRPSEDIGYFSGKWQKHERNSYAFTFYLIPVACFAHFVINGSNRHLHLQPMYVNWNEAAGRTEVGHNPGGVDHSCQGRWIRETGGLNEKYPLAAPLHPVLILSHPFCNNQFVWWFPLSQEENPSTFSCFKKKEKWSMIAQTLSDKLDLAHSVLEIRDPYDECHFLQIEKEQWEQRGSEGLWLRAGKYEVFVKSEFDWEMAAVLCCSPPWWSSYWATDPGNHSTLCLPCSTLCILWGRRDWVFQCGLNQPIYRPICLMFTLTLTLFLNNKYMYSLECYSSDCKWSSITFYESLLNLFGFIHS